jgi:membrane-bound lytic murein transglycosylase C
MSKKKLLMLASAFCATLFSGCSTQDMMRVAMNKDPKQAIKSMASNRVNSYKYNPELALRDLKRVKAEFDWLMSKLQKESGEKWGKSESATLPTRTRYVKYTENYKNRTVVDYDKGTILIEHLDEAEARGKLKNAVVTALLTPDDPGAVDLFSDKEIELKGKPYLQQLVVDQNGNAINTREDVERYADFLVNNRLQGRQIDVNGVSKNVVYVSFAMINNHIDKRALQYAATVRKYSDATQVSRSLIFAIIKIESSFNPYAVSSAPAYGMMQLVPNSGGREAYRKAKGLDESPTREYLFVAENNIELGSTYLGVLLNDSPLRQIDNPVSREYCAIAAYNTGPSNVFRAFSSDPAKTRQADALDKINAMRPDEVYETLRLRLPYSETRGYIVNAVAAKKMYATM